MGNVNGNPSLSEEDDDEEEAPPSTGTVPLNGEGIDNSMMMMTHSPPTSPRATHSPLSFTPQVSLSLPIIHNSCLLSSAKLASQFYYSLHGISVFNFITF